MEGLTTEPSDHGSEARYEMRIVALVDFLGWKDLIDEHREVPPSLACQAIDRLRLEISAQAEAQESGRKISGTDLQVFSLKVKDGYTDYRAHTIESTTAVYPRVIVDDKLEGVVNYSAKDVRSSASGAQPLCRDRDGLLFIDFIRQRFIFGRAVDTRETWQRIRTSLVDRRSLHKGEARVLANDNWMISYFNDVVGRVPQLASLEIPWEPLP